MNKIEEIFKSWKISLNPNDEQNELASKRIEICDECEYKTETEIESLDILTRCSVCGCSLKAKIFSPKTYLNNGGSCPKGKWALVEEEWLKNKEKEY
jgi:hypothetical protein